MPWAIVAASAVALASLFPAGNPDTFGHLAAGRQIAELGRVPQVDSFSYWFVQPAPWHNYEWLSDWLIFALFSIVGWSGLVVTKAALMGALGGLLVWRAGQRYGRAAAALCTVLLLWALPAARFRLTIRPHLLGFVLATAYLLVLPWMVALPPGDRRRWFSLGGLTAAHLLWVNLHGSHLLGLAITGCWLVAHLREPRQAKPLLLLLVLQAAVSCVSPFGPAILVDALLHVFDPAYRALVREWGPWTMRDPLWIGVVLYAFCALSLVAVLGLRRGGAPALADLLVLVLLVVMGVRSIRFVGELLLLGAPLVAGGLSHLLSALPHRRVLWTSAALACAGAAAAPVAAREVPPSRGVGLGVDLVGLPASSAQWLNGHLPQARVFAGADGGWYLMYASPAARVLFDGRLPFYGPQRVRAIQHAFANPDALVSLLDSSRTDAVVLEHSAFEHHAALQRLLAEPAWSPVHIERHHVLLVRGHREQALQALPLSYDAGPLLSDAALRLRALGELAKLGTHDNALAYAAWVRAVIELAPLARAGGRAGLRPALGPTELARVAAATSTLRGLARDVEGLPALHLQAAMAAIAACDLDAAEASLARAAAQEETREIVLLRHELGLHRGRQAEVAAEVARALSVPELAADPWLNVLRELAKAPPRCPGQS